jgi:hypothetical protein
MTAARIAAGAAVLVVLIAAYLAIYPPVPSPGIIGVPVGPEMCRQSIEDAQPTPTWCVEVLD